MKTSFTTDRQHLLALSSHELVALSNCVNELLHNSDVDEHDCQSRIGITHQKLKSLHRDLLTAIESKDVSANSLQ